MKNKDNPVPSLDNKLKLSDVDNLVDKYIIHQNKEAIIKTKDVFNLKLDIIALFNKLQNGVETNKEQPKCKCGFDLSVCKNTCSNPAHLLDIKWS